MRYVSTRGLVRPHNFEEVLLAGLAGDGGLFVPETWPRLAREELVALARCDYPETAARILAPFVGHSFSFAELLDICREAYAGFAHAAIAPLVQLAANDWLLELFHGPTLAFKDFALQVLGRMFERVLRRSDRFLTILGATSGDTGSAAIHALAGRERIALVILHPHERISPVQRRQMTLVDAANVLNLAVCGTFDDCQALVKALFADPRLREELQLAAINSINWARIAAQAVYYIFAGLRLDSCVRAPTFVVPTGNFGNVYAGHVARHMGLPIRRLIVATNRNDILARFFATGIYERGEVAPTLAPSMDIQVASNFERLLFEIEDGDGARVRALMAQFAESGRIAVEPGRWARLAREFGAGCADEETVLRTMRDLWTTTGQIIDPHTAVGIAVGRRLRASREEPLVFLATAHPAKFPEAVSAAIGSPPPEPPQLRALQSGRERFEVVPAQREVIAARIRAFVQNQR